MIRRFLLPNTGDITVDVVDSSNKTVNATVYVNYSSSGTKPLTDIDVGGGFAGYRIYSNWSGTYYVKVRPYGNLASNKGTFALIAP